MPASESNTNQRTYVSNFNIQLPPMFSVVVDLVPFKKAGSSGGSGSATSLTNVCPDCNGSVEQRYICLTHNDHGPFKPAEMAKACQTDAGLVPLTNDEVALIREGDPTGVLELNVCERKELTEVTVPNGNMYRLRPSKKVPMTAQYALLKEMVQNKELALYGAARLTNAAQSNPFTLTLWKGQLVLQQLVAPSDIAEVDDLGEIQTTPELAAAVKTTLAAIKKPFDGSAFVNVRAQKLAAIVEQKIGLAVAPTAAAQATATGGTPNLLAMLQAALNQAQPPAPAKPAKAPRVRKSA